MALIKNKMTDFGIEASYWKLTRISIDTTKSEISFSLFLYLNRENQQKELDIYTFTSLLVEDFTNDYNKYFNDGGENYKDIYTACYSYAKDNIEFFNDSLDG